jgi:hypothetical protein
MSSIKQKQANRLNSQKSCGPRTLQGKAVSRFNALKTGIDAESRIIPGEDPVEFANIAEEYHQRWQPALPEHRVLVDTLAHGEWQLRRLHKAEASLWRRHNPKNQPWNGAGGDDFARLQRRLDSTERSFRLTLEKLECLSEQADPSGADLRVCLPESIQASEPELPVCPAPAPVELPDLYEPARSTPAPARVELPDLYEPAPPAPARLRVQLPDLYEPKTPRNQQPNRGIGFVVRRLQTGMELRMKESHRKGIANHPDPESCVARRKAAIEA